MVLGLGSEECIVVRRKAGAWLRQAERDLVERARRVVEWAKRHLR
jgi:hypothetical protein